MRKLRRLGLLFLAVFLASTSYAQVTTEGREFWLGFMENDNPQSVELEIYLSANKDANVLITAPRGNFSRTIFVPAGNARFVSIPANEFMPLEEGSHDMGLKVNSDVPISVYALNKRQFSADAAVILPTTTLGKEYFVTAHAEPPGDIIELARESEFLVVAVQDDTEVEITPTVSTAGGKLPNVPFTITLDAGEMYLVKGRTVNDDLSGTYIRSISSNSDDCKNIAVFGGNVFTNVGGCGDARDHLLEQMMPISTWGKNFLYVPYETRSGGDYIKLIASEDGTTVKITGRPDISLNRGQVYRLKSLPGVHTVTSDKPISFAQFSRSQSCDGTESDPFFILVSPLEQRIKRVTFNAFAVVAIQRYYLTLIAEAGKTQGITLDGSDVRGFRTFGDAAYTSFQISAGNHTIVAPEGVIAFVYGYGPAESFGYSAGVALENLNLQVQGNDQYIDIIQDQACLNSDIEFTVNYEVPAGNEPVFNTFEWSFGDGATDVGEVVHHTYTEPGFYNLIMTASDGQGSCGTSETVVRTIEILETTAEEIIGPKSVCPDVTEIEYTAIGNAGNEYEWFIEGGSFLGSNIGETIKVNWGPANDEAFLKVLPKNALGCIGDTISFPVKINKRLEPEAPRYENMKVEEPTYQEVCDADRFGQKYQISPTNGSVYKWFVEGGRFVETTNASETEVYVDWFEKANGKLWYLESNPLVDECEGYSDTLRVKVFPPLVAATSNADVLCFGGATGAVDLNISGGDGTYTVEWDNGKTGPNIASLRTGNYTATVTDGLGCQINVTVTIGQPEALKITSINAQAVSCFQDKNGVAQLTAEGGTGGYTYLWKSNSYEVTTNSPTNSNLPPGQYSVSVIDANGCQVATTFEIDEPPLLQADLESLINDPVCPQASDGTAFIDAKGGTPDYQFYWSNKPNVDDKNASDLSEGDYSVRIVDANGCETNLEIAVTERFPKIFFPTAFSPNNDGENETFRPVADCQVTYYMQIYNKWGQVIFSTETLSEGWDGTYNGQDVPEGKYSYLVFYAGTLNDVSFEETYRGSFNLIR